MKYLRIVFTPKHDSIDKRATLDWISENIVAEIQSGRYGKHLPIHHDECAYEDRGTRFEALIECTAQDIHTFVANLIGDMSEDFDIQYSAYRRSGWSF